MIRKMLYLVAGILVIVVAVLTAIFLLQDRLIFYPEKLPRNYVFSFNWPVEEVFLPSAAGAELHGLYFSADKPQGVVLYFHGNAGSVRGWGQVASDFLERGYSVFMPDYRSYGKSTGRLSEKLLHHDAEVAWQFVLQNFPAEKVVIMGRSLGSGLAVQLAAKHTPKLLFLESPFNNLTDVAQANFPYLPASLLLRYSFRSDRFIKEVRCPVYMVHGTHDQVIPFALAQKLALAAGAKVRFVAIHIGTHNNLASFPEYNHLLDEVFLSR